MGDLVGGTSAPDEVPTELRQPWLEAVARLPEVIEAALEETDDGDAPWLLQAAAQLEGRPATTAVLHYLGEGWLAGWCERCGDEVEFALDDLHAEPDASDPVVAMALGHGLVDLAGMLTAALRLRHDGCGERFFVDPD